MLENSSNNNNIYNRQTGYKKKSDPITCQEIGGTLFFHNLFIQSVKLKFSFTDCTGNCVEKTLKLHIIR
jgi:hypothetical protein